MSSEREFGVMFALRVCLSSYVIDGRLPGARLSSRSTPPGRRMIGFRKIEPSNVINAVCTLVMCTCHPLNGMARPASRQGRLDASERRTQSGRNLASGHGQHPMLSVGSQAVTPADRSKNSPVFSIVCMTTASLRATATAARLKPTLSLSFSPHDRSALSARLRVRSTVAA